MSLLLSGRMRVSGVVDDIDHYCTAAVCTVFGIVAQILGQGLVETLSVRHASQ